ncbi:probable LRR receptor-like serine/threonine-protein kinase At3g47570 [Punica granatum]|uniref:non-specific serine/threonine protein kinase n=1 Tax=Punica granatum TaxID=22663 RepID=A0A6P8DC09_PUNGR|nr:probable LRR receptor-like serine/threonine-protein kinase At3g47570 [Punica granatum]
MESTPGLLYSVTAIALVACSVSDVQGTPHGNETDQLALLSFKSVMVDQLGVLSSWSSSHHFCQWFGVTCGRRHRRVTKLDLQSQELSGTISPHIGNLSFLRVLDLQNNSFHSRIPLEVGHLSRLLHLYLNNNSLSGPIPPSLSSCSNLLNISLHHNMLQGYVPANLSSLSKLRVLLLQNNGLSGEIPLSVGNFSSLEYLYLGFNKLRGAVPDTLGNLRNLKDLSLVENNLVGNFPLSVANISSMEALDLGVNQLMGTLPLDLGITLPNLQFLSVIDNRFTGSIPKSISNMSQLNEFQITSNSFTGDVLSFRKMSNLLWFSVYGNHLGSGQANDLNFLCSLTNSTNLNYLGIGDNNFGGEVPKCISNLSITLEGFVLELNALSGTVPSSIENLINLEVLSVSFNNISGRIPPEIGNLRKVKELYLAFNVFTGEIPHTLGNLSMLTFLSLSGNNLLGTIPSSLGKYQRLLAIYLADNKLAGAIPPEIMSLSSLSMSADFSMNNLTGELPVEIGNLKHLGELDLSGNKLSGKIPSSLGSCMSLEYLYMGDNMFVGSIPSTLSSLKGIQELNLSHNRLLGQIPDFLEDLNLTSLDLSFNNFQGNLPTGGVFANTSAISVLGNEKLCGGLPEYRLPKCMSTGRSTDGRVRNVSIYTSLGILTIVFMLSLLCFLWHRKQRKTFASSSSNDRFLKVSYQDLLEATVGFSSANLIGTGSFGSVFKGVLALDQITIAVKVLNLDRHGASKSFIKECEALRNIRHRNLVKVVTACSGTDYQGNGFKALVYEFMVNGSLDEWLHPRVGTSPEREVIPRQLGLLQRVNIATDVACALDYLHHQCETPIVHCDLKPSNVLIDGEMTGHVGDFGLVRFMPGATRELISELTSSIGVKGSLGYIAPGNYPNSS